MPRPDARLDDALRAERVALDRIPVIDLGPLRGAGSKAAMARDIHFDLQLHYVATFWGADDAHANIRAFFDVG